MSLPDFELPAGEDLVRPFARRVAVVIATATLLAAIVGFLQNEASSQNNAASQRAQTYAIQASQALVLAEERARVTVDAWSTSLEQRVRASNIGQQLLFAPEAEKVRLEATKAYWLKLAERTETLSGVDRAALDGPDLDPTFPGRLLANRTHDAVRLEALQDAANEVGEAWSGQSTTYTAVLAILAVALYLLGFSLTIGVRRAKQLFAVVGVALVFVAGGWTASQVATSPRAAPDEAADAYADGMVALETAFDGAGWRTAADHLTRAIDLRPTFARAYLGRATAEFALGSPQQNGYLSIVGDEALATSSDDLARAYELGLDDTALIADLGFQRFLQGIRGDGARLSDSIELTKRAIEHTDADPVLHFNLAVALLAAGRMDEARAAYDDAIARVLYSDLAGGVRRADSWTEMSYVAGALTDLEILVGRRPDLADAATGLRTTIIASVARGAAGAPGTTGTSARIDRLAADVFPSLVQWRGDVTGLDDAADTLSVIWSRRDPDGTDWAVMPEVSSLDVTPTENTNPEDGTHFALSRYIGSTVPARCLGDGTYRVELFVDGRPVGTAEATASSGSFEAFAARDVGAAFCRPADWTPDPQNELGMSAGFVGPAGDRGIGVVHLQAPVALLADDQTMGSLMDAAVAGMKDTLGKDATYDEETGTTHGYFMGLDSTSWRWYGYDGGWVRIGAGLDPEGGLYVGVAYGPLDWFDGTEWMRIVESFETFQ
jgi:tetratricopeptide (TPR) repeat protein